MKKVIAFTIVVALVLAAVSGCKKDSPKVGPKGGSVGNGESFKIDVPTFVDTKIKQGETQSVTISLERGDSFKQDVTLEIKLVNGNGITFDPAKVIVKASDKPDVQIRVSAAKDAAISEYRVSVMGTPKTGEPASTEFNVNVVAP